MGKSYVPFSLWKRTLHPQTRAFSLLGRALEDGKELRPLFVPKMEKSYVPFLSSRPLFVLRLLVALRRRF